MKTARTRIWLLIVIGAITLINLGILATVLFKYNQLSNSVQQMDRSGLSDSLSARPGPALMMRQMDFDSGQQQIIHEMQQTFRQNMKPLFREINTLNAELVDALSNENIDTLTINNLCAEIGDVKAEMKMRTMYHLMDFRALARPDQQQQLYPFFQRILMQDDSHSRGNRGSRQGHGRRNRQMQQP